MTRKRSETPPDLNLTPLSCHAASFCDCGQPAVWILYLTIGKSKRPQPFKLCDACLALELSPATHSQEDRAAT